jgi:hypothetical protein
MSGAAARLREVEVLKRDFFSENLVVADEGGRRFVLKRSRPWRRFAPRSIERALFAWLSRRERAVYRVLEGVSGVPPLGPHEGDDFFTHAFIEGDDLMAFAARNGRGRGRPVDGLGDDFFPRLRQTLRAVHARGVLYLDLSKAENVLVGDDGRPWLIDFQVSLALGPAAARTAPFRAIAREDERQLRKHWRRYRPDQLDARALRESRRKTPLAAAYDGLVSRPWLAVKRLLVPPEY